MSRRTASQLKKFWSNSKRKSKKKIATHKRELRKTGGGPPPPCLSPNTNKVVSMIPSQMTHLDNPFDCDGDKSQVQIKTSVERHGVDDSLMQNEISVFYLPITVKKTFSKPDETKRKQKDPRSSIVNMEYDKHQVRMKNLVLENEILILKGF